MKEPGAQSPVLGFVGLAWSWATLTLLGLMLMPFVYAAVELILRH